MADSDWVETTDFWGDGTIFVNHNPEFYGFMERIPSFEFTFEAITNESLSYNWLRLFFYPFFLITLPVSFIGLMIEYGNNFFTGYILGDEGEKAKLQQMWNDRIGPFGTVYNGLTYVITLPIEFGRYLGLWFYMQFVNVA